MVMGDLGLRTVSQLRVLYLTLCGWCVLRVANVDSSFSSPESIAVLKISLGAFWAALSSF